MNDRGERDETGATPHGPSSRLPDPSGRHSGPSAPVHDRSSRSSGAFAGAGELTRELVAYAPRKSILALLLLLTAGVTEAFGLLMIVPLLYLAGFAAPSGERSPVAEAMARAADAAGVEWTLSTVLVVFLVLSAVRSAVAWQREVLLAGMRLGFVDRLRRKLYAAIAGAKWGDLLGRRQSDMQHVLTRDVDRVGQGAFLMLQLTVTALLALAQLALAALISPSVTAVALAAGAVLVALTRPLVRRSRTLGEALTGANRALYGSVTNFLGGLKLAKGHNAEGPHVRHFEEIVATTRKRQLEFTRIDSTVRAGLNLGAAFALAVLIWFALSTAALPLPELLLLVLIFARVMPGLFRLQQNAQQLAHVLPAYAHVRVMRRMLEEAAETPAGDGKPGMELRRALTVRNVSFVYEAAAGTDGAALENVALDVPAGKMTAVAGPSGAGKSTLADLLLGLLEPGRGEVCIDGVPLTGSNARRWRDSVAFVPQDPYLFHDTIRGNLRWAHPEATEAEMWQALRLAAADGFVAALPEGLDTVAGDRGGRLSGGERQRITLARALMKRPALLVIDEATAQLDAENERWILAALQSLRGRTTVVAIAHGPALLEAADGIVLLQSGRVAATGTWRELAGEITAAAGRIGVRTGSEQT